MNNHLFQHRCACELTSYTTWKGVIMNFNYVWQQLSPEMELHFIYLNMKYILYDSEMLISTSSSFLTAPR